MVIASPTNYRCTIKYEPQNDRFCLLKKLNIRILIAQPSFISLIHRCKNTQTSQLILHLPLNMMTVHLHVLTVLYITKSLHPFHNQWARSLMIIGATRPWASHVLEGCGCCYILHVLSNKELVVVICIFSSNEIQCSHHIRSPVDRTGPQFIKQYSSMVLSPQSTNQWP